MAITKNVPKGEGALRVILGVILVALGCYLSGFWRPLSIVVGVLFMLTAFVGY